MFLFRYLTIRQTLGLTLTLYLLIDQHTLASSTNKLIEELPPSRLGLISKDPNKVKFFLYSTASQAQEIRLNNITSLQASTFQAGILTVFITHGFYVSSHTAGPQTVLKAYLASNITANYILVDWGPLAGGIPLFAPAEYLIEVVNNVPVVGKRLADFVHFLAKYGGLNYERLQLIGHSLGAHVSGLAGQHIKKDSGETVPRITGLDPAGPVYYPSLTPDKKLSKNDAKFVDVIYTNSGKFGDLDSYGHVVFWPNGGRIQKGCEPHTNFIPTCSHSEAWYLYANSFTKMYKGCACGKGRSFCLENIECQDPIIMGVHTPETARGEYYVKTGDLKDKTVFQDF